MPGIVFAQVMLNGGVNLLCDGLLTYQIVDAVKAVAKMGVDDLDRAIQDVTKAELAKVFASIHLEQISSIVFSELAAGDPDHNPPPAAAAPAADFDVFNESKMADAKSSGDHKSAGDCKTMGSPRHKQGNGVSFGASAGVASHAGAKVGREHETDMTLAEKEQHALDTETMRLRICKKIRKDISPLVAPWGVDIIDFALESTMLADKKYQSEYESATLEIAKAKARLRSNAALNEVNIQQARADASSMRIRAEGQKIAVVIEAQGRAAATELDAKARQNAAQTLESSFGQQLRLLEANAALVGGLKAQTLLLGDAAAQKVLPVINLAPPVSPAASRS